MTDKWAVPLKPTRPPPDDSTCCAKSHNTGACKHGLARLQVTGMLGSAGDYFFCLRLAWAMMPMMSDAGANM